MIRKLNSPVIPHLRDNYSLKFFFCILVQFFLCTNVLFLYIFGIMLHVFYILPFSKGYFMLLKMFKILKIYFVFKFEFQNR